MKAINVPYSEVWNFFKTHQGLEEFTLARDDEYGICIVLDFDGLFPKVVVYCDDDVLDGEVITDCKKCSAIMKGFYDRYLSGNVTRILSEDEEVEEDEEQSTEDFDGKEDDIIEERELELELAADDFLYTIAPDAKVFTDDYDELLSEIIQITCEYLYNVYGCSVYRPMFLDLDDGNELFSEYPYDYLMN